MSFRDDELNNITNRTLKKHVKKYEEKSKQTTNLIKPIFKQVNWNIHF